MQYGSIRSFECVRTFYIFMHGKQSEAKRLANMTSDGAFAMPSGNSVCEHTNIQLSNL